MFLLFPCCTDRAISFYRNQNTTIQANILGSSTKPANQIQHKFHQFTPMVDIYHDEFADRLKQVVEEHQIQAIITPNDLVAKKLAQLNFKTPVIDISTDIYHAITEFKEFTALAETAYNNVKNKLKRQPKITIDQIICILNACSRIPGQTSLNKILELIEIFESIPVGDVLEIGVLFGKSGIAFGMLNDIYLGGDIYLIDTWLANNAKQHDSPQFLQSQTDIIDWDTIFARFKTELTISGIKRAHVIRGDIGNCIEKFDFHHKGMFLSLVHIDGNHDYEIIKRDLSSVFSMVKPGGIIICDDYNWIHGQGVKQAVTEFCEIYKSYIDDCYVIDKSAVIRKTIRNV